MIITYDWYRNSTRTNAASFVARDIKQLLILALVNIIDI